MENSGLKLGLSGLGACTPNLYAILYLEKRKEKKKESDKDTGAQLDSCGYFKLRGVVLFDSRVSAFNLLREYHGVVEEIGSQE